ncbi:adenosylcobinamide-GDP ribazoletransferase [Nocardioides euryhalodurans]|uniref:Adenosylcobinamide-GDP ribazoletransferase n=1 Tax=Nocardioides euryhalodurans TaxID=2518370 RepID=A0A4P7GP18_9ACTN|nr:adenosylcobinamide-GDP ribazoletransferase [Nocardioides euryhalodurans]QBR93976.1 adenosylcobinamide-GDP ribazoletransferase [Nocardioides euryhalodurans]
MSLPVDATRLAVGTLTVLPVEPPSTVDRRVAALAMTLAPLAVLPLAVPVALLVWAGDRLDTPALLTGLLAVGLLALGSGGLHLDGLADTADGLTVPGDTTRRLAVMRTGDVGPVGAATLLLVMSVQAVALAGTLERYGAAAAALTAGLGVVVSRGCLVIACSRGVPAARGDGLGSAVAGSVPLPVVLLVLGALTTTALLLDGGRGVAGVTVAAVVAGGVLLRAVRRLGGVTGDVLGAVVELALAGYLVAQVVGSP